MRRLSHIKLWLSAFVLLMQFASCSSLSDTDNLISDDAAILQVKISVPDATSADISTRAIDENAVSDVTIFVFNSDEVLIGKAYQGNNPSLTTGINIKFNTAYTGCTVYAIANANANSVDISGINTLTDLKNKDYDNTSLTTLSGSSAFIMTGKVEGKNINAGDNDCTISLERIGSKMAFKIVPSDGITITKYQLCHIPQKSFLVSQPTMPATVTYSNFDPVTTGATQGTTVDTPTYYVTENLAGKTTDLTSSTERNYQKVKDICPDASYLLVTATGTDQSGAWTSTYRIYLGGKSSTDFNDFNIYRNFNYTYTIKINGSGQADARVAFSGPVVVGDYLFNDGTWGPLAGHVSSSVWPIGVIFSSKTSDKDQTAGWKHGYAMALNDAEGGVVWSNTTDPKLITDQSSYVANDLSLFLTDMDGLSHCSLTIAENSNNPAFYAAHNYGTSSSCGGEKNAAPTSVTSGWYLPSIGQWNLIVKNLGALVINPTYNSSDQLYFWGTGSSITAGNAINRYINLAQPYNADVAILGGDSPDTFKWYWTSTEYNDSDSCICFVAYPGNMCLRRTIKGDSNKYNRVRPVIAF